MALNVQELKAKILSVLEECSQETNDPKASRNKFAQKLATAIDDFVKSGEVIVSAGISVQTTGTQTAQMGKTTSVGKGKIT